jgi:hypothetical protein
MKYGPKESPVRNRYFVIYPFRAIGLGDEIRPGDNIFSLSCNIRALTCPRVLLLPISRPPESIVCMKYGPKESPVRNRYFVIYPFRAEMFGRLELLA